MVEASVFSGLGRWSGDRRRVAILIGSIGVHIAVLTLIALELSAQDEAPAFETSIQLDITPWPRFGPLGRTAASQHPPDATALADRSPALAPREATLPAQTQDRLADAEARPEVEAVDAPWRLLALIGLGLFEARLDSVPADTTPIFIQMEPRPLLAGETARVPSPSRTQATETRPQTGAPSEVVAPRKLDEDEDAPSSPAPRAAAGVSGPAAPGSPAAANPWTYTPESQRAAVARSLRTGAGGCRIMDGHLSAAEQALCDDRFNAGALEAARRHPLGGRTRTASEQRRDAEFAREGAVALARYEALRRPLAGGVGIGLSSPDCPGGNLSGSCAGAHLRPEFQHPEDRPIDHARRE